MSNIDKSILEEMRDHIVNGETAFVIKQSFDKTVKFIKTSLGDASFIYGAKGYSEDFYFDPDVKYELIAIYKDNVFYIIDTYFFDCFSLNSFNEFRSISDYITELTDYIKNTLLPPFYDALPVSLFDDDDYLRMRTIARKKLLTHKVEKIDVSIEVSKTDALKILTGYTDIDTVGKELLEQSSQKLKFQKFYDAILAKYDTDPNVVQEWEYKMANGLMSVLRSDISKQYVNVKFSRGGVSARGKITLNNVLKTLVDERNFSSYDFDTSKKGEEIMKVFGVKAFNLENYLRCKDIYEITYGKKGLYSK